MSEFVLPQGIQLGEMHQSFRDIHTRFSQTDYGAILNNNIRYSLFKPDSVSNSQWQDILGIDVNNLEHLALSHRLTERFLHHCAHPHQNWQKELSEQAIFTHPEQELILTTATLHDWAESVVGDISYLHKTEADEEAEMTVLHRLITEVFHDADNAEDLSLSVQAVLSDRSSKLGQAFNAIERVGYMRTGMNAWKQSFKYNGELGTNLQNLASQVVENHTSQLEGYAEIYPPVDSFLNFHRPTINQILEIQQNNN